MRRFHKLFLILSFLIPLFLHAALSTAGLRPKEPEEDNSEYILDMATNEYNRLWREIWDGGDNRLRFRLGSNNVREWFIEEELKFSTRLLSRLRLRFYHSRLLNYTTRKTSFNTIEFEGNIDGNFFLSVFACPTSSKADNAIGIVFQRRTAVNKYAILYMEFPRFFNNFTEHHKETSDSILAIYSRQPVKFGLEVREHLAPWLHVRLSGYLTNTFETVMEQKASGKREPLENGSLRALAGWVEYVVNESLPLSSQTALGIEGAYSKQRKSRLNNFTAGAGGTLPGDQSFAEGHPVRSSGLELPVINFGNDPFTLIEEDTLKFWKEERKFISPYAWVVLCGAFTLRCSLLLEKRTLQWTNERDERVRVDNSYLVPAVRLRARVGARRISVIEGGFVAEYRQREERRNGASIASGVIADDFRDHRFVISYEYSFGPNKIIRIVESIDLDREDWGQFSIHDHGFFQLIVGF